MLTRKRKLAATLLGCTLSIALFTSAISQCPPVVGFDGPVKYARMGSAVASVGDVDADGVDDFAIAARGIVSVSGAVYVISGQTHQIIHVLEEPSSPIGAISFGSSVAGVSDLNQDGHADILIGVRDSYGDRPGHAFVFSGIDGSIMYSLTGEGAKDMYGSAVASAGDWNEDGINDFIVVALLNDFAGVDFGRVYLYSGSDAALLNTFEGHATESFGSDVVAGADLNGDGRPEIVVGATLNSENLWRSGKVYVYSGSDHSLLYAVTGSDSALGLGSSLSLAGDLNDDGVEDFAVGAPGHTETFGIVERAVGGVEILSGADGSLIHAINAPAEDAFVNSGYGAVSAGGDIDGDGIPDIAVSAAGLDEGSNLYSGGVFIYSGANFQLIRETPANTGNEFFGAGIDLKGDYNQDGLADLIVGAIENNSQGIGAGRAYVYTCAPCCSFAGDANNDSSTNIADVTFLIGRIFSAGPAPFCADAADANGDNMVNIADATTLIARIFSSGPEPICGSTGT